MHFSLLSKSIAAAGSITLVAGVMLPAQAAPSQDEVSVRASLQHQKEKAKKQPSKLFKINGLVTSRNKTSLAMFASTGKYGSKKFKNKMLKIRTVGVKINKKQKRTFSKKAQKGFSLSVVGRATGPLDKLQLDTVKEVVATPSPAHVFVGMVKKYDAANKIALVETKLEPVGPPDEGEAKTLSSNDGWSDSLTVNVSQAAVSVDGEPGELAVGQFVAIMGEVDNNIILAASVIALTEEPMPVGGVVESLDGNNVLVSVFDDDMMLSYESSLVEVDLTGVPVALNGSGGYTVADIKEGDHILILGRSIFDIYEKQASPYGIGQPSPGDDYDDEWEEEVPNKDDDEWENGIFVPKMEPIVAFVFDEEGLASPAPFEDHPILDHEEDEFEDEFEDEVGDEIRDGEGDSGDKEDGEGSEDGDIGEEEREEK